MANKAKEVKCLCVGDVNGNFALLVKKVALINKSNGPFDLLFCVGEFFGPEQEENEKATSGIYEFPVPTYVLGPCCPSTTSCYPDEGVEFSPSLTFLGRRGILYTAQGLSVGYLSGVDGPTATPFQFGDDDIDELLLPIRTQSGFLGVDVLLTSMWPRDVARHSVNQPSVATPGSTALARLAAGLKPRYHFAGMSAGHFERTPYRNHRVLLEAAQHVTRFIGLAAVGNKNKEKWIYAFSIKPMLKMPRAELTAQPGNATEFPYMETLTEHVKIMQQKEREAQKSGGAQFFFDTTHYSDDDEKQDGRRRGGRDRGDGAPPPKRFQQQITVDQCWFCLSNVDAERHLVISVGSHTYLCQPKGPLTSDHVMVLSVGHVQSLVAASTEIRDETTKYKDAYTLMCDGDNKAVCVFERNYKTSHMQVQMVPVAREKATLLKTALLATADKYNIELTILSAEQQVWQIIGENSPYFLIELPDATRFYTRQMASFPLHFGREVIAHEQILDCRQKIEWKECVLDKKNETKTADALKARFKSFDFAADSDSD